MLIEFPPKCDFFLEIDFDYLCRHIFLLDILQSE